ncbi:lysine--tRNA ligase [Archaeoglobus veneficus]|uniref:Lysine--tRNA ligase n=1 Tax=Archaeoglobus veneficus (strain DSM 11195 / SNP6) TaxID=693661 RepID=F2KN68_ARCVS|nr:lysine--tRNA ligase [Archaeoglobus veneficus]AEA46169.1 Lysyl-tRNA synthetase [Archaeoglobus veneficus SNP6]
MSHEIHWADCIADELLKRGKKHRIATGITPSGHIHLGNLREMLTADAVRRAVIDRGGEAEMIYIADTFDPLRKRYPFLPEEYENYVGMPLSEIPDPEGCHESYAEHFLQPFLESLDILGIDVRVEKADEMYKEGRYEEAIKTSLRNRDKIAQIIKEVTGRAVDDSWSPFMPLCEKCGRINSARVTGFDDDWIYYSCQCGHEGKASYKGGGKLAWRIDWPARWKILGITCEPFGKDHAAAGGSYDTGVRLAREVFGFEPPFPIVYEWINLKGVGAMKSSKGIVVPVREMVDVLPPEIVRYIIIRSKPERHIEFDPAALLDLVDEFEEAAMNKDRSVELSMVEKVEYSEVPFRHLIVVGQIAKWNLDEVLKILERTGYKIDEVTRKDVERRLVYAKRWLEKFAPEKLKFEIKDSVDVEFSEEERKFLNEYAERLKEDMNPEDIHELVYEVANELGIKPAKAFKAIYKAILGKTYGPRAGYFIKSLGIEWVKRRLKV